jgi:hypothetical protein
MKQLSAFIDLEMDVHYVYAFNNKIEELNEIVIHRSKKTKPLFQRYKLRIIFGGVTKLMFFEVKNYLMHVFQFESYGH